MTEPLDPALARKLLLVNLAATWGMVGVIWIVQLVHYPLFSRVGEPEFVDYQAGHVVRISWVVLPLMLAELATAMALVLAPEAVAPRAAAVAGLALVVLIWLSTFLLSVPCHSALETGFDAAVHARLVVTNWPRTILWTVRGVLVAWLVARLLEGTS